MEKWVYILISVVILTFFLVVFFWSFVAYKKTPLPKGCEDLDKEMKSCATCGEVLCPRKKKED